MQKGISPAYATLGIPSHPKESIGRYLWGLLFWILWQWHGLTLVAHICVSCVYRIQTCLWSPWQWRMSWVTFWQILGNSLLYNEKYLVKVKFNFFTKHVTKFHLLGQWLDLWPQITFLWVVIFRKEIITSFPVRCCIWFTVHVSIDS